MGNEPLFCPELYKSTLPNANYELKVNCKTKLDKTKINKLNGLFEEVNTKMSNKDHNNPEILDIQTAVHTMLERIVTRVNQRGIFKITHMQPCGSMVEKTAVWKYSKRIGERYTEFDFLANLAYSVQIICRDQGCGLCVRVSKLPVNTESSDKYQSNFSGDLAMMPWICVISYSREN